MREGHDTHGVRGGFPPKGGKPHHPHGRPSSRPHGLVVEETLSLHDGEPMDWWTWDDQGRGDLESPERETSRPATSRRGMTPQNPKEVFHSAEGEIEPALHRLAGRIGR